MIILQQEEAKSFFQSIDSKALFKFFNDGSMLRIVQQEGKGAATELQLYKASLDECEKHVEVIDKEIEKFKSILKLFKNLDSYDDGKEAKNSWGYVYHLKGKLQFLTIYLYIIFGCMSGFIQTWISQTIDFLMLQLDLKNRKIHVHCQNPDFFIRTYAEEEIAKQFPTERE
jgi:hypothetical protein